MVIVHIWRQVAKRVFVHQPITRDTIDETIMGVLRPMQRVQDTLFEALMEMSR